MKLTFMAPTLALCLGVVLSSDEFGSSESIVTSECDRARDCAQFADTICASFPGALHGYCMTPIDKFDTKLMVLGGSPNKNRVEVIDLSGEAMVCSKTLKDLSAINYAAVGVYINDHVMVCSSDNNKDSCFIHDSETDTWSDGPKMNYKFFSRGSVLLGSNEWIVAGGWDGTYSRDKVEIFSVSNNSFATTSLKLPRETNWAVLLPMGESSFIFLGGEGSNDDAYIISKVNNEWGVEKKLPTIPRKRRLTHAGLVTYPDGRKKLVVAGDLHNEMKTDVFDFDCETWTQAADLPYSVHLGTSVPFKETFLIVGGYGSGKGINSILEFDPANETWIERKEHLANASGFLAAFIVPDDYITCN